MIHSRLWLLPAGLLAAFLTSGEAAAQATATCTEANGRTLSENDGNPATFAEENFALTLGEGESAVFTFASLAAGSRWALFVDGVTVLGDPQTQATLTGPGTRSVRWIVHEARVTLTTECGGQAAPPPPPSGPGPEEKAARLAALYYTLASGRPSSAPSSLPDSSGWDVDGLLENLRGNANRFLGLIRGYQEQRDRLRAQLETARDPRSPSGPAFVGSIVARISSLDRQIATTTQSLQETLNAIHRINVAVVVRSGQILPPRPDGRRLPPRPDAQAVIDGTAPIPYAPTAGTVDPARYAPKAAGGQVPWPGAALGYGHHRPMDRIGHASDSRFSVNGTPFNLWTRLHGTLLDGSFGRTGAVGALQAGLVAGINPNVDLGVFGHLLTGRVESAPLNSRLDTAAGAIGAYTTIRADRLRFGLSALHEWGTNDIAIGPDTGRFNSSHWSVNAEAALPLTHGSFVITPSAVLGWHGVYLEGYVDSAGTAVPARADSTLVVTGALEIARPVPGWSDTVSTVVPRLRVAANYFAGPAQAMNLGALGMLAADSFTVDVEAGAAFGFAGGAALDFGLHARGIGGSVQGYGGRLGLRVPLGKP